MLRDVPRWVIVVICLACVVGLVIWARGNEHFRGIFEGAIPAPATSSLGPTA